MSEPAPVTPRGMFITAAIATAIGGYFVLVGLNVLPPPGGPRNQHAPFWLVFCIGACFLLAGLALFIQTFGHADQSGKLPAGAPRWMKLAQFLICFTIFACFALIASWIAFGPGERAFSGSFVVSDAHGNGFVGRIAFGFGAILTWLGTAAVGIYGYRKLLRPGGQG
jgi:multisubunit Na+/H+ antiporter MnhB subunit